MNTLTLFRLIAWAAAIFNAATAALVLVYLCRPRDGKKPTPTSVLLRAAAALLIALACFMVEAVLAIGAGGPFGLILLAYLSVALVPPGMACALAWVARYRLQPEQRVWPLYAIAFTFLAPPVICAYASWIAPFQLVMERADVELPNIAPSAGVRIGVPSNTPSAVASVSSPIFRPIGSPVMRSARLIGSWPKSPTSFYCPVTTSRCPPAESSSTGPS